MLRMVLALLLLLGTLSVAAAYEIPTHRALTGIAVSTPVEGFVLQDYVRTVLNLPGGLGQPLSDGQGTTRSLQDWIVQGAGDEDVPLCRSARHFHNPLAVFPWDDAGLRTGNAVVTAACGPSPYASSARWSQLGPSLQDGVTGGGNWSWQDARNFFFDGLTALDPARREASLARTFQALGHQMHFLQDASVPAHVRNNTHLLGDAYERDVDRLLATERSRFEALAAPAMPFDRRLLDIPVGSPVPVPITRAWDADLYDGTNPAVMNSTRIGIAEFANANFVSQDTIFRDFRFPSQADIEPGQRFLGPGTNQVRQYFRKRAGTFPQVEFFVVQTLRNDPTAIAPIGFPQFHVADRQVTLSYAAHLLPRAVGYSAGLLQYFFRGAFVITQVPGRVPLPGIITVTVQNTSSERMTGNIGLFTDDPDGTRHFAGGALSLDLAPGETGPAQDIVLAIPPTATGPRAYAAVFTGQLGGEPMAIAAGRATLTLPRLAFVCTPSLPLPVSGFPCQIGFDVVEGSSATFEASGRGVQSAVDLAATATCGPSCPGGPIALGSQPAAFSVQITPVPGATTLFGLRALLNDPNGFVCVFFDVTTVPSAHSLDPSQTSPEFTLRPCPQ